MSFEIVDAKRSRRPIKATFQGVSGSGKTYTALRMAFAMRRAGIGKSIVVGDSENESAGLYAGITEEGETWQYKTFQIPPKMRNPKGYTEAYEFAVNAGHDIVIMDSTTHCWQGALNRVDELGSANKNDKFGAGWRVVTPEIDRMISVLTDERAHLITTTRVKSDYEIQLVDGRKKIEKVGMKAVDRDGMEYEYDMVVRIELEDHLARVEKVRGCREMDGAFARNPGAEFFEPLFKWWLSGDLSLFERLAASLTDAGTMTALQEAFGKVRAHSSRLTPDQMASLIATKDRRKAEFDPRPEPAEAPPAQQ